MLTYDIDNDDIKESCSPFQMEFASKSQGQANFLQPPPTGHFPTRKNNQTATASYNSPEVDLVLQAQTSNSRESIESNSPNQVSHNRSDNMESNGKNSFLGGGNDQDAARDRPSFRDSKSLLDNNKLIETNNNKSVDFISSS